MYAQVASTAKVVCTLDEVRPVHVDHEDILCNWKVRVSGERWPSFIKLVESALSSDDPQVYYEEPIE